MYPFRSGPVGRRESAASSNLFGLPTLGIFAGTGSWLGVTAYALVGVVLLGALSMVLIRLGARFHWWSSSDAIRLKRRLRVTFGALFLTALVLPYLLAHAPATAIGVLTLTFAALPFLLAPVEPRDRDDRITGEHAEIDG